MRITPYIISLLAAGSLFAQGDGKLPQRSTNIEPRRAYVLPCSSAVEAAGDKSEAMRYAIPVGEWDHDVIRGGIAFNSSFYSPFSWKGRQAILSIESATAPYRVYVDGREIGSNMTPSMPAQFNVTRYIKSESDTSLKIEMCRDAEVSKLEGWREEDGMELGQVLMLSQPTMYLRDVDVTVENLSGSLNAKVALAIKSEALNTKTSRVNYELLDPNGAVAHRGFADLQLDMRREDSLFFSIIVPDSLAWSAEKPNLYRLNLSTQYRGRYIEYQSYNVGLRSVEIDDQGNLAVNGKPQKLKVARVAASVTVETMAKLKAQGYNTLKVGAGELNREIYNYADSVGLYMIATAPIDSSKSGDNILRGGNPTNDPSRKADYIERSAAIYHTTKIHPSVIAYDLADESLNGINLYESYLYLKGAQNQRPVIYLDGAGEWNSDNFEMELDR